MSKLGIIIVHYQAEDLLARCIEALEASRFRDFDVVIVDNGSAGGLEWVERHGGRYRVEVAAGNIGFAAACNRALTQLRRHELVLLLNPDVMLEPDTIASILEVIESDEKVGAATCKLLLGDRGLDPACRRSDPTLFSAAAKYTGLQSLFPTSRIFGRYNLTYVDASIPCSVDSGTGAFLLIRRAALDAAGGGLDESFFLYGEDLDLCRRMRLAGYEILYWPHATATHIKGSGRLRSPRATFEFYRAMWVYYRKWGAFRGNVLVLAPLLGVLTVLGAGALLTNVVRAAMSSRTAR